MAEYQRYNIQNLRPIELNDLVRIGRSRDGGYVVSKSQIERSQILLCFGINHDWNFEWDFVKNKDVILHGFDYSISEEMFCNSAIKKKMFEFLKLVFFKRRFLEASRVLKWIISKKRFPFSKMFNERENRFFHKKFLGNADNDQFISVDGAFKYVKNLEQLDVFVKIDIEGGEYEILPAFEPYFEFINSFVIEFHNLDCKGQLFEAVIEKLKKNFYVAHIHANNHGSFIHGTALPVVLEITFINMKMLNITPTFSTKKYPIKNLDAPCYSSAPDLPLPL